LPFVSSLLNAIFASILDASNGFATQPCSLNSFTVSDTDLGLSKKELSNRRKKWKPKKMNFGNGTLWKYAQTVGPAYLGASTHPGKKKEVKCYADI